MIYFVQILRKRLIKFDLYDLLFKQLPRHYRRQDALIHGIVCAIFLVSILLNFINILFFKFTSFPLPLEYVTAVPGLVVIWIVGVLLYSRWPRIGLFFSSFSQTFLFLIIMGYALSGMITTPFPTIDQYLLKFDDFFKFSTLGLLQWTYAHTWLVNYLSFCYDTWLFLLLITPIALAFFKDRVEIDRYMVATFVSFFIGGMIYYFFPTVAPAGILQSPHFVQIQHDLVIRFNEVHQRVPITTFDGGMIAFPSFHVINSLLVLYAWRRYFWVFLPLLVINFSSIFSTMALGYHYLADVIAGFIIAFLSVKLASKMLKRL